MNSTDPLLEEKNEAATDYIDPDTEFTETVSATNDSKKRIPKTINRMQLKKQFTIGRNETCPCGSGLKYKKCHLFKEQIEIQKQLEIRRSIDAFNKKSKETEKEQGGV